MKLSEEQIRKAFELLRFGITKGEDISKDIEENFVLKFHTLETENEGLKDREKMIRKFWDCSEHDFEVIATGKGTFESDIRMRLLRKEKGKQ